MITTCCVLWLLVQSLLLSLLGSSSWRTVDKDCCRVALYQHLSIFSCASPGGNWPTLWRHDLIHSPVVLLATIPTHLEVVQGGIAAGWHVVGAVAVARPDTQQLV